MGLFQKVRRLELQGPDSEEWCSEEVLEGLELGDRWQVGTHGDGGDTARGPVRPCPLVSVEINYVDIFCISPYYVFVCEADLQILMLYVS